MLISSILPSLADPSNAYNQQHLYVLNSLAQVKSIVLLTDIPDSEKLTTNLFTIFFDILASSGTSSTGEQIGKNVEFHMTGILITMVDESASLPPEVVDVIVAQFLRIDPHILTPSSAKARKGAQKEPDEKQSTLLLKELPPSYNMAKTICNSCADKMARHISQYFNDIIVDASAAAAGKGLGKKRRISEELENSDLDLTIGPTEEDLRELRKAHQLLRELWRACPGVLQNVVPQLEAELSAENVQLRLLATEAFGDIISGIGVAGPPPLPVLDPASYPYTMISESAELTLGQSVLTKPSSPQPFSQAYSQAYSSFLSRIHDRSPLIRAAWVTGISRVLRTSAGGVGLSQQEEEHIVKDFGRMLADGDEKVRVAAVRAVGTLSLRDVVLKLGALGGIEQSGSVLSTLAERMRDRKHTVRIEAMRVLSRLWGVSAGEIMTGDERVLSALSPVPSKIFETYFTNDLDIHLLIDEVVFDHLLPLTFPPVRTKAAKITNGNTQKSKDSQLNGNVDGDEFHPDKIRTERILLLARGLGEKAKKVFYALQGRQSMLAQVTTHYLMLCEEYNAGVMDKNEKETRAHLSRLIENLAKGFPDSSKVSEHLWKFAKLHDRRAYQLMRFCMAPDSEYRTVYKAFKELKKRIEQSTTAPQDILSTLVPLLYRISCLIYNRSNIPAIMELSRMGDGALTATAHEMLRDISTRTPEVLKAQVQELCKHLQDEAPTDKKTNDLGALDDLKACASFAKRFEKEIPKDRKFAQAMMNFALYGLPAEAAKHAVTILMTASDKKELHARDLVQKCVNDFAYGTDNFLSRLATLSQLWLFAHEQVNEEIDKISEIAIGLLLDTQDPSKDDTGSYSWSDAVDQECEAKCWALKILVNRVRSHNDPGTLTEIAEPVYTTLIKLIEKQGEVVPSETTPATHKSRLRLLAARLCLKLCTRKSTDALLTASMFNKLALLAQDSLLEVRSSFLQRLKKYISSSKLSQRFYTIPFLLAYEPIHSLQSDTTTWIRSRTNFLHNLESEQPNSKVALIMESTFARLLSLLAHHPDYASTSEDLVDFARYILFYLHPVATEDNLSLIYHIAQRVKQTRDAVTPSREMDENLYHLSDLAQLTIRKYEEAHNWTIQTQPGKASLPKTLFAEIKDHSEAQGIAEKSFLPGGLEEGVEALVKSSMRAAKNPNRKRKSDGDPHETNGRDSKKAKPLPIRKVSAPKEKKVRATANGATRTPKKPKSRKYDESEAASTMSERRRSGRQKTAEHTFKERESDEDDEEMMEGVAEWTYTNEDGEEVEVESGKEKANAKPKRVDEDQAKAGADADEGPDDGDPPAQEEVDEWATPDSPPPPPSSAKTSAKTSTKGKKTAAASKTRARGKAK